MSKQTPIAWIASFGLHGLILMFALLNWKTKPLIDNSPSISVDIIAENASAIGPMPEVSKPSELKTEQEMVSQEEPSSEPIAPELESPDLAGKPEQLPQAEPAKPLPQRPLAEAIAKLKPTPLLPPKQPPPNPPKQAAPKAQPQQASAPAPKKSGETPPLFDLAAATKAASGVNSGGRSQPKLSNAKAKSAGSNAGGGSRLQGDLASALRNQVKDCWHEPADLSDPARLIVELNMELAPDGNFIRSRLIKPSSKAGADGTLLIAIDNAQRAAKQCAPYDLPEARYDEWKSFVFRFDPRELRR